jgi:hypothetical protein
MKRLPQDRNVDCRWFFTSSPGAGFAPARRR